MPSAPAAGAAQPISLTTSLAARAAENLTRNTAALRFDRAVALPPLNYCIGRDGSLTAYDSGWLAGCSVPRRAAEVMLRATAVEGNVACLVRPNHAGQIAACLQKVGERTAVIALLGDAAELPPILACFDFSNAIAAGRLLFAWDETSIQKIFVELPGLPIPLQFVRLATAPADIAEPAMKMAQGVFASVVTRHTERIRAARELPPAAAAPLCVVGPADFRLWDDATATLANIVRGADESGGDLIDTDRPASSASAYVAERIAQCRAVITAGIGRADRPELAQMDRPWICWVTRPRLPTYLSGSPRDALLLADPSFAPIAAAAGWPATRVRVAGYPVEPLPPRTSPAAPLTIIADLPSLEPPKIVCDYSSWRVAWEGIIAELRGDPLRLGGSAETYFDETLRRLDIASDQLPRDAFLAGPVAGAYLIGIAGLLKWLGAPPVIYGGGWDAFAGEFDVRGDVTDRAALRRAAAAAGAMVDPFTAAAHPIRAIDRPLLRPAGMTTATLKIALNNLPRATRLPPTAPISLEVIEALLTAS